ncbi:hypothetical protein ACFOE1_01805 [Agromyces mediolanus]|uniref:Uncharacterized protein n=1 Tax=Agromyces mediolanus TaxID=41986 RepID=A0A918FFM6_AGRME|nr:hypothetical protein [Agromyces mediolanus]GGR34986.1 hypothetical protein GCM10010196_31390 [Agromyces mediolanus]GLJ74189.1 hypothetical protein GCM10017583_34480 [Agromyces mediolanus]
MSGPEPESDLDFDFGAEANALLDALDAALHEDGWAAHYSTRRGLSTWFDVARQRWAGSDTVDDYTNDLCARDALELALERTTGALHERLAALVERADQEFLASTEPDSAMLLGKYFRLDSRSGWWWRRIPVTGGISEQLRAQR